MAKTSLEALTCTLSSCGLSGDHRSRTKIHFTAPGVCKNSSTTLPAHIVFASSHQVPAWRFALLLPKSDNQGDARLSPDNYTSAYNTFVTDFRCASFVSYNFTAPRYKFVLAVIPDQNFKTTSEMFVLPSRGLFDVLCFRFFFACLPYQTSENIYLNGAGG